MQKAVGSARRKGWSAAKRNALQHGLEEYVRALPSSYRAGLAYLDTAAFEEGRDDLAEASRIECIGGPALPSNIWQNAPHAFRGIANVASRVNYIVHVGSSLAAKHELRLRFFRQREVLDKLGWTRRPPIGAPRREPRRVANARWQIGATSLAIATCATRRCVTSCGSAARTFAGAVPSRIIWSDGIIARAR